MHGLIKGLFMNEVALGIGVMGYLLKMALLKMMRYENEKT